MGDTEEEFFETSFSTTFHDTLELAEVEDADPVKRLVSGPHEDPGQTRGAPGHGGSSRLH